MLLNLHTCGLHEEFGGREGPDLCEWRQKQQPKRVGQCNFFDWNGSYRFLLSNDDKGHWRDWFGELHLVAVHCRALNAAEMQANFDAGQ